jgi:hypothetical protein
MENNPVKYVENTSEELQNPNIILLYNGGKNGNKIYIWFSFYAQMCKYSDIANKKHIDKIMKIFKPIQKSIEEFDDNLTIETNFVYY